MAFYKFIFVYIPLRGNEVKVKIRVQEIVGIKVEMLLLLIETILISLFLLFGGQL